MNHPHGNSSSMSSISDRSFGMIFSGSTSRFLVWVRSDLVLANLFGRGPSTAQLYLRTWIVQPFSLFSFANPRACTSQHLETRTHLQSAPRNKFREPVKGLCISHALQLFWNVAVFWETEKGIRVHGAGNQIKIT